MDLTYNQFQVVRGLFDKPGATQREIAETARLGLATANAAYKECVADGLIDEGRLTAKGMAELRPYAVDNAVILAAGLSSRFAPISYERPKGLLRVRGEILIERQIEQLKAAGVSDIVVVVGYRKEAFFYLEDKYGVRIVINRDYAERNNSSSIMLVREILGNTYICSSDNYFEVNPFESHVWKAYYSAQFFEGSTDEWCMETGAHGRITKVEIGGSDAWGMIGHAYFDREFSSRFRKILETEYDLPETRGKLWEHLYIDHIREFDMRIRRYDPPVIHEFDSLDELQGFDPLFLENVSSEIFDNIVAVLDCKKSEIRDVWPIKQGMTNLSCHFATDDGEYVYRHPGTGSDEITNRRAEVEFQKIARKLGIDGTYVHEDPDEGWKISRYVDGAGTLDYHNWDEVGRAMTILRKLHDSGADCGFSKDMHEDTLMQLKLLDDSRRTQFGDFAELFPPCGRAQHRRDGSWSENRPLPQRLLRPELPHHGKRDAPHRLGVCRHERLRKRPCGVHRLLPRLHLRGCAARVRALLRTHAHGRRAVPLRGLHGGHQLPLVHLGAVQRRVRRACGRIPLLLLPIHEALWQEGC